LIAVLITPASAPVIWRAALTDCARFMLSAFRDALIQRRVRENGTVGVISPGIGAYYPVEHLVRVRMMWHVYAIGST
jgi:hypothetical protein